MSENDTSSNPTVSPEPQVAPEKPSSAASTAAEPFRLSPWVIVAFIAICLLAWQWFETRHTLAAMEQSLAQRLNELDTGKKEEQGVQKDFRQQINGLQEKMGGFDSRLGQFDGKLAEFQGQSTVLQGLYQDAVRSRDDLALLEVEHAVTLAGQQLQLAANVPIAKLALQKAENRLSGLEGTQYIALRKSLNTDIELLNALPVTDIPVMSLQLEQIANAIEKLPLAAYDRLPKKATIQEALPAEVPFWKQQVFAAWSELKSLVRIQRVDVDQPILLAPEQAYFLRENIKLRLLNARLALLSRDEDIFRSELAAIKLSISRYFLTSDKSVLATQKLIDDLGALPLKLDLPDLNETQLALKQLKVSKEKQ